MADMFYAADVLYPEYRDGDEIKEYVQQVSDYLFLLREGLGYTLDNLSMRNFNPTALEQMADVIREPVMVQLTDQEGKLSELAFDLDGLSLTVADNTRGVAAVQIEADNITSRLNNFDNSGTTIEQTVNSISTSVSGYISKSTATQTESGFELSIIDGHNTTAAKLDQDGLTVYNGNIKIKNTYNTDVLYADTYGNLNLTGTINGSNIYGSEFVTCLASAITTTPNLFIGTQNNEPIIQSRNGTTANGFRAVGSANNPYFGLMVGNTADWRTYYETNTGYIRMGFENSSFLIQQSASSIDIGIPGANTPRMYITSAGMYLYGVVSINGNPV